MLVFRKSLAYELKYSWSRDWCCVAVHVKNVKLFCRLTRKQAHKWTVAVVERRRYRWERSECLELGLWLSKFICNWELKKYTGTKTCTLCFTLLNFRKSVGTLYQKKDRKQTLLWENHIAVHTKANYLKQLWKLNIICLFVWLCWLVGTGVATTVRSVRIPYFIAFLTRFCQFHSNPT